MQLETVKWIGRDGGWKVGKPAIVNGLVAADNSLGVINILVQHSHTGELEWVEKAQLERYPTRSEWEDQS